MSVYQVDISGPATPCGILHWTFNPCKTGLPRCPTMLGTNHPVVSYNIPEEQ